MLLRCLAFCAVRQVRTYRGSSGSYAALDGGLDRHTNIVEHPHGE